MSIAALSIFINTHPIAMQKKKGFLSSSLVWPDTIPCVVYVEMEEFNPENKTYHTIFTGNLTYSGYLSYRYTPYDQELVRKGFFKLLSELDNSGWNAIAIADKYLEIGASYEISTVGDTNRFEIPPYKIISFSMNSR